MNTIQAFEKDMYLQSDFLKSFKNQKILSSNQQTNAIFSGSGDSLVSAMLAESFSGGIVRAMDPLDLLKNKQLVKSKHVYFISISGNTVSNIKVAKTTKKTTAITSMPHSRLAKISDKTILLSAPNHGVFTAGSISFLESALTCISLVKKINISNHLKLFSKVRLNVKKFKVTKRIFILGNLYTYPIAMYCAAKFYEILGYNAQYSKIEQFSHMELFSVKKGDTVIIFEEKNTHNKQLSLHLKKIGINVIHPDVPSEKLSQILYCIFFSQFITLFEAKKKKKKDCHFVLAKNIRNVSNQMIY
jgi:glucosamine 6-phosphate synthetase-like amidotransferase/phosphosugar isomerase protein